MKNFKTSMIFWRAIIFSCFETIFACDNRTLSTLLLAENGHIDIHDYPLPKLCQKMFNTMPKINYLMVYNCQVEEIETNFLQYDHPNVTDIVITQNKLFKIKSETFANLATKLISLSHNHLEVVENQAFKNLENLLHVSLIGNQLASFDSSWFEKVPQLTNLDVGWNKISALPENSFKFLETANAKLYFDHNKISILHKNTMSDTSATNLSLFLDYNIINSIPNNFFKNLTFNELTLLNNPIAEFPEDFFFSDFTLRKLDVPLHQFKAKTIKQIMKWAIEKKAEIITRNFPLKEDNCSSKVLINFQILFLLQFFRQLF